MKKLWSFLIISFCLYIIISICVSCDQVQKNYGFPLEEEPPVITQVVKETPPAEKYRITEMEDGSYIIQEKDAFGFWGSNPGAEYYWVFENEQAACEAFEQLIEAEEDERNSKIVKRVINCK